MVTVRVWVAATVKVEAESRINELVKDIKLNEDMGSLDRLTSILVGGGDNPEAGYMVLGWEDSRMGA